ncbi:MAG: M20/M25/M40 family metallo-hydrolase [Firmicutes bacterium]|nr:M20/M25/M40 family metallo-hydrolase [Bacillota bacterium]
MPQDRTGAAPPGGLTAEVVYAGYGRESDYAGNNAAGKIALQETWGLDSSEKLSIARHFGVAGLIWIHAHPGGKLAAWGLTAEPASMPVVCVSYEDGQRLRRACQEGPVVVRLDCDVAGEPGYSDHLFMEIPGTDGSGRVFMLVAHRDTTHISPGANDNASGMAAVLEIMRAFRDQPLPFGLRAMFSAAEEGGGIGLAQYAREHLKGNSHTVLGAINLDMISVGSNLRIVTGDKRSRTSARINEYLARSAASLNYHLDSYEISIGLADTGPLLDAGIPASWLFKPDDPRVHTDEDLPEHVNANDLKVTADIVAHALISMGNDIAGMGKGGTAVGIR